MFSIPTNEIYIINWNIASISATFMINKEVNEDISSTIISESLVSAMNNSNFTEIEYTTDNVEITNININIELFKPKAEPEPEPEIETKPEPEPEPESKIVINETSKAKLKFISRENNTFIVEFKSD